MNFTQNKFLFCKEEDWLQRLMTTQQIEIYTSKNVDI